VGANKSMRGRKADHLRICLRKRRYTVETGSTWLDEIRLVHRSLPEMNAADIDTTVMFLGRPISMPIFISSMTGGSAGGFRANKNLAQVAQEAGIPVGLGSIRILFRNPEVIEHFLLRPLAPDVPIFANIGGVQLRTDNFEPLVELIKRLEVDGLAVHLNVGQELVQPEGDSSFFGVLNGIERLCEACPVPVIAKETGFGINPAEAKSLLAAGVQYVDVAGRGGTNWAKVEAYRLPKESRGVANELESWGTPTALLLAATRAFDGSILASGGIRSGMDVAKSIALGAVAAGLALPFIRAVARGGVEAGVAVAERIRDVLHTAMLLTGSRTVADLRSAQVLESMEFAHAVSQLKQLSGVA
jgi:isopentenyl-diphosphate delta-isomerase